MMHRLAQNMRAAAMAAAVALNAAAIRAAVAGSQLVPASADIRIISDQLEMAHQQVHETICRRFVVLGDIAPNVEDVLTRTSSEPICHQRSSGELCSRASRFNSSASLGRVSFV